MSYLKPETLEEALAILEDYRGFLGTILLNDIDPDYSNDTLGDYLRWLHEGVELKDRYGGDLRLEITGLRAELALNHLEALVDIANANSLFGKYPEDDIRRFCSLDTKERQP